MSIGIFIAPASTWRAPAQAPATPAPPQLPPPPDWQDYASRELWREAILAYLRSDWHKNFEMWKVLNQIVAESCQGSKFDVRAATYEALGELMQLRRERAVFRYRRRWIAILDMKTPLPPLD